MAYFPQFVSFITDKIISKDSNIDLSFSHNGVYQPNSNIVEFIKNNPSYDINQKISVDKLMLLYHTTMMNEYKSNIYYNNETESNDNSTENTSQSYNEDYNNSYNQENYKCEYDDSLTVVDDNIKDFEDSEFNKNEIVDYEKFIDKKVDEIVKEIKESKEKKENFKSRGKKRDPTTWRKHLKVLIDFIDKHKHAPKYNDEPKSLYIWMITQKNWSKPDFKKKNEDNYEIWVDFVNEYKEYLSDKLIKTIQ